MERRGVAVGFCYCDFFQCFSFLESGVEIVRVEQILSG